MKIELLRVTVWPWNCLNTDDKILKMEVEADGVKYSAQKVIHSDDFEALFDRVIDEVKEQIKDVIKRGKENEVSSS